MAPIKATLTFAPRQNPGRETEKFYMLSYIPDDGFPRCNYEYEDVDGVDVHDMRSANFSLVDNGMEVVSFKSRLNMEDYNDTAKVEDVYLTEVSNMLKKMLKTDKVYIFDYLVRKAAANFPYIGKGAFKDPQPAVAAHIDHSPGDVRDRVSQIWKDQADRYLEMDTLVVNIWKPVNGTARSWPMAYCDRTSVDYENDVTTIDDVQPTQVNEILNLHHNPNQKWYFVPDQRPDEAVVFVEYDSRALNAAVPHCAFGLETGEDPPRRESIEVRALVFL